MGRGAEARRLLIGTTDGRRWLTLVMEQTLETTTGSSSRSPAELIADLLRDADRPAA
jgi:hypothetical protein